MITVLAGGVGAARLLAGMVDVFGNRMDTDVSMRTADSDRADTALTAIVNVADDERIYGLDVSPDLDTVMYTVAGANDDERGWGLRDESWRAMDSLRAYGAAAGRDDVGWFQLGDVDLGTHLFRTARLADGATLSEVTSDLTRRWAPGIRLLPVSDDRLATRLLTEDGLLRFQEYFVGRRHSVPVTSVSIEGATAARPAPGVLDAIGGAEVVVIAPSNPIVSIGPLWAVAGVRDAVRVRRERCVAVSPIVGGRALKGPADRLMAELGHESSVVGVARLYRDVASVLVVDEVDADRAGEVEATGMRCVVAPTVMTDRDAAGRLARTCVDAVRG
ncbi:MAG: 2-phospho-L-lactate transferase [Microthrixaceae bacterium]